VDQEPEVNDEQAEAPEVAAADMPELEEEEMGMLQEIWAFLRVRKKFWLAPIIVVLVLLFFLVFLAGSGSVLSPFIYAL